MPADADFLCQSYNSLKAQRQPWESTWQAIADTMAPAFNDIQQKRTPGQTRTQHLFDSTGLQGMNMLAAHIAGAITNFQMSWFDLRMSYGALNEIKAIGVWLEACAKTMHDKLSATTTPQAFHENYLQLCGFGTGALFTDESPMPSLDGRSSLLSRSIPIGTYCVAEDAAGMVDTMYRELDLSPRQAVQYFGDGVHAQVKLQDDKAESRHVPAAYLHVVYPRNDRDPTQDDQGNMAYASCYVDLTHKHLCSEGGYRWFPYMVSRWQKLRSWSPWGFGPGHIALPEVLTLNLMDRDILKALQIHILPPFWSDDPDAVGRVMLLPGRINTIAHGSQIQPMQGPGNFNISHLGMEERRQRIKAAFYMDQLMALPPLDKAGHATAYEIAQRVAFYSKLIGPAFMRILSELLNPFIDIVFGTMLENDELPEPPDELIEAAMQGYGKITVDYQGPLARAQKGDELDALEMTMNSANNYYAVTQDMSIYDNIDKDEWLQSISKIRGTPARVMNDQKKRDGIRQERAEAQQQAQETQEMIEGAKALGPASQMVKALTPAPEGAAV
jgi:hypothetical protein